MTEEIRLIHGDCLEVMKTLPGDSVDAVVTDPPAGIAFMGKTWDKPGVLGVSGGRAMPATMASRNPVCRNCRKHQRGKSPRPVCDCESPDFDTADGVSRERSQFIDFLAPRMAEAYRIAKPGTYALVWALPRTSHWTATAVEDAGWTIRDRVTHLFGQGFPKAKSCLKPGAEDWWLAYKPGGPMSPLQIDVCRIEAVGGLTSGGRCVGSSPNPMNRESGRTEDRDRSEEHPSGRWPANVVLDEDAAALLDEMSGTSKGDSPNRKPRSNSNEAWRRLEGRKPSEDRYTTTGQTDSGGASRFFYCPKATRADRGEGNDHPTVKNVNLMRWLCRLITPPGGVVLDLFCGTASTGKACIEEGFGFIGIEQDRHYHELGEQRLESVRNALPLFAGGYAP